MKMFYDNSKSGKNAKVQIRDKKHYAEIEFPTKDKYTSAYLYLFLNYADGTCQIASCWGNLFDFLHEDAPAEVEDILRLYFPATLKFARNAIKDKNGKTQLYQTTDPKDGITKWVLCREVQGLALASTEDFREIPGLLDEVSKLMEQSMGVSEEYSRFRCYLENTYAQDNIPAPSNPNAEAFERGFSQGAGRRLGGIAIGILSSILLGVDTGDFS